MFAEDSMKQQRKLLKVNNKVFIKQLCYLFFIICLISSFEWSSSEFGLKEFFQIILYKVTNTKLSDPLVTAETILFHIRLPRLLTASLCGAALGLSGVLSQGLFRNSLASPSLIGSSSGATLGAVLCFYKGQAWLHSLSVPAFAILGSLLTTSLLLFIYTRLKTSNMTQLLLIGLSFSTLSNALCSLIISVEDQNPYKSFAIYRWLLGGFNSVEWSHFKVCLIPLTFGIFWATKISHKLDILALGEELAYSLGVDIKKLKIFCLLLISLLLGTVTSIAGSIPFIGLIAPHITRTLIGCQHKELMKFTLMNSISLILMSDLIAKKMLNHKELEIGIVLSILGAPFFIYLILRRNNLESSYT